MRTPAALLLLAAGLVAAGTPRNQSEHSATTPTPTHTPPTFTDSELECFRGKQVLYSDGQCYPIRQQGPCLEGEWIVLAEDIGSNKPRVVCKRNPCPRYSKPFYWPEDGQCHRWSDANTLCPHKGVILTSDSYGEGECTCMRTYARYEPDVVSGRNTSAHSEGDCYLLFRRGPCPVRKLLVPATLEGFGLVGRCDDDVCHRQNAAEPGASYVLHRPDNTCYKLGTTGNPCSENEIFDLNPENNKVHCMQIYEPGWSHAVFSGGDPRCPGNINQLTGECRERVFLRAQTFGWQVTQRRRETRRSRHEK